MSQLVFPELVLGSFWVVVRSHGVISDGARFLVVQERGDGWWLAWREGVVPKHAGTLLKEEYFQREKGKEDELGRIGN